MRQLKQCHIKQLCSPHLLDYLITAVWWKFLQILDNYDRLLKLAWQSSVANHDSANPLEQFIKPKTCSQDCSCVKLVLTFFITISLFNLLISKKKMVSLDLKSINRKLNFIGMGNWFLNEVICKLKVNECRFIHTVKELKVLPGGSPEEIACLPWWILFAVCRLATKGYINIT